MKLSPRGALLLVSFLLGSVTAGALESIDGYAGLLWIGNPPYTPASDEGAPTGAPSPILNTFAIALPISLGGPFYLVPEIGLFGTQYGLVTGHAKTVPVEREFADAIWFLGALVELGLWLDITISDFISLGFDIGASFLGRIPMFPWGDGWSQLGDMTSYLYGEARYLYPEVGVNLSFRPEALENLEIVARGKSYFPIFHAWDNEESDFVDQFMVTFSLGLRFMRPSNLEADAGDESASSTDASQAN